MRLAVDPKTHQIIQVEKTPPAGESTVVSGKYYFYLPDGVDLPIPPDAVIVPYASPQSVVPKAFLGLLRSYPQFDNVIYNALILDADMDLLDPMGVLNDGVSVQSSRLQMGRGTGGPLPSGVFPNSVAVLPPNGTLIPAKPGVLVTSPVDINPLTSGQGASSFAVYWRVCEFLTTPDTRGYGGSTVGQNTPAERRLIEIEQEVPDLEVFVSNDAGVTYLPVQRLIPTSFCNPGSQVCVAFRNTAPSKRYVLSYAVLF